MLSPSSHRHQGTGRFLNFCPLAPVIALTIAGGLVLLLGCGVAGPPQPPHVEVPERTTDLSVLQVGRTLEIRFTKPRQTTDGERLTEPLEIEVLQALAASASAPPALPPFAVWKGLQPNQWARFVSDERIVYPVRLTDEEFKNWQAKELVIAVRTLTRGFRNRPRRSEISNPVKIRVFDVSGPVGHLAAEITEKAIELRWQPPATALDGQPVRYLAGYSIYRSLTGQPGSFQLVGESKDPQYFDSDFEFGHAYSYEVRATFKQDGASAESEESQPYEVVPRDTFPPARPVGLTALYAAGAVELVWTANTEKDLAGYYVYRSEKGEKPKKLNTELLRTPILRDISVQPGHTYIYQVTAVDLSSNESQPSAEVSVETSD